MTLEILADLREKSPWTFRDVKKYAPDAPDYTLSRRHLPTGDYTLEGQESACCLERKSRKDFINTLTQDTRRFLTEFSRMDKMRFSAVIVEDRLETFLRGETSPGQMVKRMENPRDFSRSTSFSGAFFRASNGTFADHRQRPNSALFHSLHYGMND